MNLFQPGDQCVYFDPGHEPYLVWVVDIPYNNMLVRVSKDFGSIEHKVGFLATIEHLRPYSPEFWNACLEYLAEREQLLERIRKHRQALYMGQYSLGGLWQDQK